MLSDAYRQQYDFNSICVIPTNMYGPTDNFSDDTSHVIPAIIKKIHNAIQKDDKDILLWGDGSPTRDFLFVKDTAKGIVLAAEKYNESEPVNLASGKEVTVKNIAELIKKKIGYKGNIIWDQSKPTGPQRRVVDITKAKKKFGYSVTTSLENGINKTIQWYMKQTS